MLAKAEVRYIQVATPELPLFDTVEVGRLVSAPTSERFPAARARGIARAMRCSLVAIALCLTLSSCALGDGADDGANDDDALAQTEQDTTTQWYTTITREYFVPSAKIATEVHKLFKSEAEWVAFFGEPSPGIDFTTNWAIFYTPGTQRSDLVNARGWRAKLSRVTLSATGKTMTITTRLESNGDCPVRSGKPFITATIHKLDVAPTTVHFAKSDTTRTCE